MKENNKVVFNLEVKKLDDLEEILNDINEKSKALQEAVRKLEWFNIDFELNKKETGEC